MRTEEFVIRGKTASGGTETLNFSGFKPGYAYRLVEFQIYPASGLHTVDQELSATITAGKTAVLPTDPDFNNDGLIATALLNGTTAPRYPIGPMVSIVNDTFLITQDLLLQVIDTGGSSLDVNWQCKFMPVKMSGSEEAVANYQQFTISDG